MGDNMTTIRLELGINAQKFINQVQINNETIEKQISKGIELALKEITEGDNFIQLVKQNTKTQLIEVASRAMLSYDLQKKIKEMVQQKMAKKIEEYSDKIVKNITSHLE